MNHIIFYILGILLLIPVIVAYYFDYRSNPKEFTITLKSAKNKLLFSALIFLAIYFSLIEIWQHTMPLNKENGIEFNTSREKIGIPIIGTNWEIDKSQSEQFQTFWWKPEPRNGHFKKVIAYGLLNIKTETDYYQNVKKPGTFAWSVFDFKNKTFHYYIEKPNSEINSVSKAGTLKFRNPTVEFEVAKDEFEKYIEM